MQLQVEQVVHLADRQGQQLGQIKIERREENLISGRFVPAPAFSTVQLFFQEFEEAVNLQALSVIDELDTAIAALGLYLQTLGDLQRIETHDVQIWSDGSITCRVGSVALSAKDKDRESRQPVRAAEASGCLTPIRTPLSSGQTDASRGRDGRPQNKRGSILAKRPRLT